MSEVKYAEDDRRTAGTVTSGQERKRAVIWAVRKTATTEYGRKRNCTANATAALDRQEPKCVSLCMKKILKDWKEKR